MIAKFKDNDQRFQMWVMQKLMPWLGPVLLLSGIGFGAGAFGGCVWLGFVYAVERFG